MAVLVSFMQAAGIGSLHAPAIGRVRATETVSVPGSTSNTAQSGEFVIVTNTGDAFVLAGHGTVPDAAATVETGATSAGVPIPPQSSSTVLILATGSKVNVKALA